MKLKLLIDIEYDPKVDCISDQLTIAIDNALSETLYNIIRDENDNILPYNINIAEL